MRISAFVLILAFGGAQTVAWSDCCCLKADRPQPAQAACEGCEGNPRPESKKEKDDCCGDRQAPAAPAPAKAGCTHVHPSQDVVAHAPEGAVVPAPVLVLPVVELPAPAADDAAARPSADAGHRPERGRPLYLLDATLLI